MTNDYEELSYEASCLLTKLAKRSKIEVEDWYYFSPLFGLICNICNKPIVSHDMRDSLAQLHSIERVNKVSKFVVVHGLFHLKESNLLPFI